MFTQLITVLAGAASFISVVVMGGSHVSVNTSHNQSTSSVVPSISVMATPSATVSAEVRQKVQQKVDQATASAKAQIEAQRTQALSQVDRQFDDAIKQVEDAKFQFPQVSGQPNPLDSAINQLELQRQHTIDQINSQVRWPY